MMKTQKTTITAICVISIAAALTAMIAIPAYAANAQADYLYALNQENWVMEEEYTGNLGVELTDVRTITIEAKGYAFSRIDEETLKQYNCETFVVIQVQPATETAEQNVDVTGSVKVNDVIYKIESGQVALKTEKKLLVLSCQGPDESGNQISLKLRARYFWWGGNAYAFRSMAIMQTADNTMLLLQRGTARIQ